MIGWSSAFYLDSKMCSASDFGTIYGGSEYTIESSTFGMDSTYSTLQVAGQAKFEGTLGSFWYVKNANTCILQADLMFPDVDLKFVALTRGENDFYAVGIKDGTTGFVMMMPQDDFELGTSQDNDCASSSEAPSSTEDILTFDLSATETILPLGILQLNLSTNLLAILTTERFMFRAGQDDLYSIDIDGIQQFAFDSYFTVASYNSGLEVLRLSYFEILDANAFLLGDIDIDHGYGADTPVIRIHTNNQLIGVSSHLPDPTANNIYLDLISVKSDIKNLGRYINAWGYCLGVYVRDETNGFIKVDYLFLQESNVPKIITVAYNFDNDYLLAEYFTTEIELGINEFDYYSLYNFGALAPKHVAIHGLTTIINGHDFGYTVGVVHNLFDQTRYNSLFANSRTELDENFPSISSNWVTSEPVETEVTTSQESVTYQLYNNCNSWKFDKNGWQAELCPNEYETQIRITTCTLYDYQKTYDCKKAQFHQIIDRGFYSELMSICTGVHFIGYITDVDLNQGLVMNPPAIPVLGETFKFKDTLSSAERGKVSIYGIQFYDDRMTIKERSFIFATSFFSVITSLNQGESYKYAIFERANIWNIDYVQEVSLNCKYEQPSGNSTNCEHVPNVFKFDKQTKIFTVDGKVAEGLKLRGTFSHEYTLAVNLLNFDDSVGDISAQLSIYIYRFVVTLNYQNQNEAVKSKKIKINKPFAQYYLENNGTLPYTMTRPSDEELQDALIENEQDDGKDDGKDDGTVNTDEAGETLRKGIPQDWSSEDYEEALDWSRNKEKYKASSTLEDFSVENGVITVKFTSPGIDFPNYMYKEFNKSSILKNHTHDLNEPSAADNEIHHDDHSEKDGDVHQKEDKRLLSIDYPNREFRRLLSQTQEQRDQKMEDDIKFKAMEINTQILDQYIQNGKLEETLAEITVEAVILGGESGQEQKAIAAKCKRLLEEDDQNDDQDGGEGGDNQDQDYEEYQDGEGGQFIFRCRPQQQIFQEEEEIVEVKETEIVQLYFGSVKDMIKIYIIDGEDKNLSILKHVSVKLLKLSRTEIQLKLKIDDTSHIDVDIKDSVMVRFGFNDFDTSYDDTDKILFSAHHFIKIRTQDKPIQFSVGTAANIAVVGSAIVSTIVAGSLSQVWGMLNGMELMIYMRLLSVKFPDNAAAVTSGIIEVANFEVPGLNVRDALGWLSELPEEGNASVAEDVFDDLTFVEALEELGFDSRYMGDAMGTPYLFYILTHFIYFLIPLIQVLPCSERVAWVQKLQQFLKKNYIWNFQIRFLIQTCLDIQLVCLLNINLGKMPWQRFSSSVSFIESLDYFHLIVLGFGIAVMPFIVLSCLHLKFDKLEDDHFKDKYESAYSDLDTQKRSALFQPFIFMVRRLILVLIALYWRGSVWKQLIVMIELTMFISFYQKLYHPFQESFTQKAEFFNEVCLVMVAISLMGMTDAAFEGSQIACGYIYGFIIAGNLSVHFFFLIKSTVYNLKMTCRKRKYKRMIKVVNEKRIEACAKKLVKATSTHDPNANITLKQKVIPAHRNIVANNPSLGMPHQPQNTPVQAHDPNDNITLTQRTSVAPGNLIPLKPSLGMRNQPLDKISMNSHNRYDSAMSNLIDVDKKVIPAPGNLISLNPALGMPHQPQNTPVQTHDPNDNIMLTQRTSDAPGNMIPLKPSLGMCNQPLDKISMNSRDGYDSAISNSMSDLIDADKTVRSDNGNNPSSMPMRVPSITTTELLKYDSVGFQIPELPVPQKSEQSEFQKVSTKVNMEMNMRKQDQAPRQKAMKQIRQSIVKYKDKLDSLDEILDD